MGLLLREPHKAEIKQSAGTVVQLAVLAGGRLSSKFNGPRSPGDCWLGDVFSPLPHSFLPKEAW